MTEPLRRLGKYEIIGEVGKGGFATVYRARDLELERDVALKILDPLLTRDPLWVARFRREARAVAGLEHPRIVTVYEIGQSEGLLFIAMKLADGGSLAQRLAQNGRLAWLEVVRLAGEISQALDFAHGKGVMHRDLKPANVLLDSQTGSVLTDFGFARLVADNSMSISMSGGVVGTPAYIAPEVWEGAEPTPQADIYALGCIVYEMIAGRALFTGATSPAVMLAHFKPPALPEAWPEDVPAGVRELLATALEKDPAARYVRAGDFAAALASLAEDALAGPYAALQAAIAAQAWTEAMALAGEIRARQADYRDVAALERQAAAGLERAARVQSAAQWRATAEEALAAGDLAGAQVAVRQWQQVMPDDPELSALKTRLVAASQLVKLRPESSPTPPQLGVVAAAPGTTSSSSVAQPPVRPATEPAPRSIASGAVPASEQGPKTPRRSGFRLGVILLGIGILAVAVLGVFAISVLSGNRKSAVPLASDVVATAPGTSAGTPEQPTAGSEKPVASGAPRIGIVLPTKDEPRWLQDEARFKELLAAENVPVEILFSQGDSAKEKANVESLLTQGAKVIIITPQDGALAAAAAEAAHRAGAKVISFDRLILGTDAVDYYVAFDFKAIGEAQAKYLVDKAAGTGNPLYLYAGAASDNAAFLFFEGAWNVLQPKIADGTFVIKNSSEAVALQGKAKLTRDEMAKIIGQITTNWDPNVAKTLAEANLTVATAADKGNVFILAPNDGTARSIADTFAADKDVTSYVVTGQDAEIPSVQYIIDGKQSMTVFKDIRMLSQDAIAAALAFLKGGTPEQTTTYNNGTVNVPAKPSKLLVVDQSNVKEAIIDSGYYTPDKFTGL